MLNDSLLSNLNVCLLIAINMELNTLFRFVSFVFSHVYENEEMCGEARKEKK